MRGTFALTAIADSALAFPPRWARLTDAGVMVSYTAGQWLIHDGLRAHGAATSESASDGRGARR